LARGAPDFVHRLAIATLAGSVLAFEIILLRLFEFSHWHHFAGLAIALALLGFGASGTLLSLLGRRAARFRDGWFTLSLLLTATGLLVVLMLHARVSLRPLFAVWDAGELLKLLAVDFAAFVPFFGAGLALGQAFARWPAQPGPVYAANLIGSGAGTLAATTLLAWVLPERALALVATVLLLFAATFAGLHRRWPAAIAAAVLAAAGIALAIRPPSPQISDFKTLARAADLPDARTLSEEPGLSGRLTVLRSDSLRYAPGLSLEWAEAVPADDLAVVGSDHGVPVRRDYTVPLSLSQASLAGLPLALRPSGPVLAVGTGSWSTPAHAHGRSLAWLVDDVRIPQLARARGLAVEIRRGLPIRVLERAAGEFVLISIDRAFNGRDAAREDYLMTVDGLGRALAALQPGGLLAIPLSIDYPPRNGPRLFRTLAETLITRGIDRPDRHIAALRGLQSMLVLVSPRPLTAGDLERLESFAARWRFDRVWLPGLAANAANRYHQLDQSAYHEAARAALTGDEMPGIAAWFEDDAATGMRPYFWRAMRWLRLPALFEQQGTRAASYLDWTLVMSAVALAATTIAAALLIVAPLGRMPASGAAFRRHDALGYFGLLGMAFMLVELAFLQRVQGWIDVPILASALVFAVFMIGSGAGSASMTGDAGRRDPGRLFAVLAAAAAPAILLFWGPFWSPGRPAALLPEAARLGLAVVALAPMAWAMGRLFPWGLARLGGASGWLPWAWAINGFASVVAASAATLSSVHLGQRATLTAGCSAYAGAWAVAKRVAAARSRAVL